MADQSDSAASPGRPAVGSIAHSPTLSEQPGSAGKKLQVGIDDWVRTKSGWVHRSALAPPAAVYQPALHPLVVAALVLMLAVAALVACSEELEQGTLTFGRTNGRVRRPIGSKTKARASRETVA